MEGDNGGAAVVGGLGIIRKQELVRVVIRFLYSQGYHHSAAALEDESELAYGSPQFLVLVKHILNGDWEEAVSAFARFNDIGDEKIRAEALFYILQQCILECLSRDDIRLALRILQTDFSKLLVKKEHIHQLALILILNDVKEMSEEAGGAISDMRERLVIQLANILPPPIIAPFGRLERMIEEYLVCRLTSCLYHNFFGPVSILENHFCGEDHIPTETIQILKDHTDEVWFVQFSNNGEYLASSSSDCTAIIWKVPEHGDLTLQHILRGHRNPVSFVSWSPNDKMLLTVGFEEVLKLWDVETGICMRTISEHSPISRSCSWFPDSEHFVFGSNRPRPDKCVYMCKFNNEGFVPLTDIEIPELIDLAILPNGETLIYIFFGGISVHNLRDRTYHFFKEESNMTSLSVSKDGTRLIVSLTNQEIHSWNVDKLIEKKFTFVGHTQEKFAIRSCIGGWENLFVASGSEDSQVYMWHWGTSDPIKVLSGHSMVVNTVSWNPKNHQMLASASDDHTIRIWGSTARRDEA